MVVSPDSCHAAHPEQDAAVLVVLAGSAREEDDAGGRSGRSCSGYRDRLSLYSQDTMGSTAQHRLLQPAGSSAAKVFYKSAAEMQYFKSSPTCHFSGNGLALELCNSDFH